jgi:hypothetical protein
MERINRIADNPGVDETWNAAREYLKKHGAFPAVADAPGEGEGQGADPLGSQEFSEEPTAPEASPAEAPADSRFFYLNRP